MICNKEEGSVVIAAMAPLMVKHVREDGSCNGCLQITRTRVRDCKETRLIVVIHGMLNRGGEIEGYQENLNEVGHLILPSLNFVDSVDRKPY